MIDVASDDYIQDWSSESNKIVEDVLRILREQEDTKQQETVTGTLQINPQQFIGAKTLIVGPIALNTSFIATPHITFSQKPEIGSNVYGIAINYVPFLVQPFVHDLTYQSGTVDGIYIGLYALTDPGSARTHEISWQATGQGSRYRDEGIEDAWSSPIDYNEPTYLIDNSEEGE